MIPVAEPFLSEDDIQEAIRCIRSGWISSAGDNIPAFEERWATVCQRKYGIAVSNGSVALDVAVRLLDLAPGDEVIMPSFTIISCATAVVRNGGVPVLVDQESTYWQMDVSQIEAKITPRTKAIMVVHIYGHPVDMDPILALCSRYNLRLIEDAAEAHGALYKGRPCGSFGDISTFSFFANKLITTGEGGMVLVNDQTLAERARSLRNLCFQPQQRFLHAELGENYRLTNLQAALGVHQVSRIDSIVARKREIAQRYHELLRDVPGITLPHEATWARNVYWIYGVVIDERYGTECRPITSALKDQGVDTRPFFLGMHEQPALLTRGLFAGERYPIAENLARSGFYIPSGMPLKDHDQVKVAEALKRCLTQSASSYATPARTAMSSESPSRSTKDGVMLKGQLSEGATGIYNEAFYDRQKSTSLRSAEAVVPLVCEQIHPRSVIDFGCGVGTWLSVFKQAGARDILGLELSTLPESQYLIEPKDIRNGVNFASDNFSVSANADLAVCLEVAEHIHERHALTLVKNLCASAPIVLFSAAHPGQTGVAHINEQPLYYWRNLFKQHDFELFDSLRPAIQHHSNIAWWYRQNVVLFISKKHLRDNPALAKFFEPYRGSDNSQERIAYVSDWVLEKQKGAIESAAAVLLDLANHQAQKGDLTSAAENLERVIALEIKSEILFRTLSNIYRALGQTKKADEHTKSADEFNPVVAPLNNPCPDSLGTEPSTEGARPVTVIVPTYNRSSDLSDLLESLCHTTTGKEQFEIIVVDNNSTDNTKAVFEKYRERLPNLRYVFESTPGLHAARHRGLKEASHELLAFLDDDVLVNPDWVRGVSDAFKDEQVMMATGKIIPKYEQPPPQWLTQLWSESPYGKSLGWYTLLDFGDRPLEVPADYVWGANFAVRKKAVLAAGGFHPDSVPESLLRYRGDGETGLARKIGALEGKALYHPLCNVLHKVSSQRMTPDYLYKRGFAQGISDSYSAVRKSKQLQDFRQPAIGDGSVGAHIQKALVDGWNFHQKELRADASLLEWVMKDSYYEQSSPTAKELIPNSPRSHIVSTN